jgi:hypothetical protein
VPDGTGADKAAGEAAPETPGAALPERRAARRSGPAGQREGTKRALVLALLAREQGASLGEITAATGWLPHTARAALTGLRQSGYAISRSRTAENRTVYRMAGSEPASGPAVPAVVEA